MYGRISLVACVLVALLLASASGISAQEQSPENPTTSPLTTAFTYQGRLKDTNGPVNNNCDFEFKLFASAGGSDQVGDSQPRDNVLVEDGYFTVDDLDFGAGAFQGEARWLEVAVRCPAGSGVTELLTPRQALTAAPHAWYAKRAPWSGLIGIPAGFADGVDDNTLYSAGFGLTLSGEEFSVDTSLIQARVKQSCSDGSAIRIINQDGSVTCQDVSGTGGGDITAVYAGTGLLGGSETGDATLSADPGYLQRRVGSGCATGNAIRVINADGTVSCESDDNTTYSAGPGLNLNGTQFSINFAGYGTASTASHSDHKHWGQIWAMTESGNTVGLEIRDGSIGLIGSGFFDGVVGNGTTTDSVGVFGYAPNRGVFGRATASSGTTYGVQGYCDSSSGTGVQGSGGLRGVWGSATNSSGTTYGVVGESSSTSGQGAVGIASSSSGTTYGVVGYSASPAGFAGYFRNTSSGVGLYALTDSGSGNIIEAWSSFSDREFSVDRVGNVHADGSYLGGGGDYAELFPGTAGLEPGDVLVISLDGQLTRSTQPFQTSVAGVYSTQPGFLAGAGDESSDLKDRIPLAVVGIVPVKASAENGPIQPGDLLTTSSLPGYAMRCSANPLVGTVIGKALEPLAEGTGLIKMLVVLQ